MKRFIMAVLAVTLLAGCGPKYMVAKEPCIDVRGIKPAEGKAALVVGRTTIFGGGINFENYLNRKFIGSTKGHSFFVTTVEPGDHYVSARGENFASLLVRFEPNKTYYIQNEVRMGVFIARVKLDFVDAQHLFNDMAGTCQYFEKDPTEQVSDLNDEEWKWVVEDFNGTTPINAQPVVTVIK